MHTYHVRSLPVAVVGRWFAHSTRESVLESKGEALIFRLRFGRKGCRIIDIRGAVANLDVGALRGAFDFEVRVVDPTSTGSNFTILAV